MFCEKCGKEVRDSQKFCNHCGHKLNKDTGAAVNYEVQPEPEKKVDKDSALIIVLVTVSLIIAITLGVFIVSSTQSDIRDSGIGVYMINSNNVVVIQKIYPYMPAKEAGIEAGDTIIKINNKDVYDSTTASEMLRGKSGTKVKVTVLHNNQPKTYTLKRRYLNE